MLTEDAVVDAVCQHLVSAGYVIEARATTVQRGEDIVAVKDGQALAIEAKGAGSSKPGSARYGNEFNSGQVFDHIAKAVLKALRVVSAGQARGAIALPDNQAHRREVRQGAAALSRLDVAVFWVADDGRVAVEAPWEV